MNVEHYFKWYINCMFLFDPQLDILYLRMWDMSALIRRCEIFGLFYSFCSLLVVDAESQTRDQDVGRHVDVRTITFLEGLLLWRRSY